MKNIFLSFSFLSLLFACEPEAVYNESDLLGTWHCYQWETNGDMQQIGKGSVNFNFTPNKYEYKGGDYNEEGTWKFSGDLLVTKIEGLVKKEVKLARLSQDTLILDMLDNGVPMMMYLAKE